MHKKIILMLISVFAITFISSCTSIFTATNDEPPMYCGYNTADLPDMRELLLELGFTDDMQAELRGSGLKQRSPVDYTIMRDFSFNIFHNFPNGPSGEVILAKYYGGIYFNNEFVTYTVMVLEDAFAHPASITAIMEMLEFGIIIRIVEFAYEDIRAAINTLNNMFECARDAGASTWGLRLTNRAGEDVANRISLRLHPYTDEQIAIFMDLLQRHSINPAMFALEPSFTQEAMDWRKTYIASVVESNHERIVPVGDIQVSRTGITFLMENRTDYEFLYFRAFMDMVYYKDGYWRPVEHLPGTDSMIGIAGWPLSLQSGYVKQYRNYWHRPFGELPLGRYKLIQSGRLGEWCLDHESAHMVVEFVITADCPVYLP